MTASLVPKRAAVAGLAPPLPLACPACAPADAALDPAADGLCCPECGTRFPAFRCGNETIPWLFPAPADAMLEWKARYDGFLHENAAERRRLREALDGGRCSEAAARRIRELLDARAAQCNQVADIVATLGLPDPDRSTAAARLPRYKLHNSQGLVSYYQNVFRDWAWDNGENEALLDALVSIIGDSLSPGGSILTLGSGACRLPYDLHLRYSPALSVALDINPLLLLTGCRVIRGSSVPLFEFPIAPLDEQCDKALRECRAPVPISGGDGGFHFVLADALTPPFAAASFETVVTPWLIDILPQDLARFIPRINRLLAPGGTWLNTGSLTFSQRDEACCYREGELLDLIESCGFEILNHERRTVPYLQSPLSAHGRMETILSFAARKTTEVVTTDDDSPLPGWLLDTDRPVPTSAETTVTGSSHLLTAQVLSAIDGQRSIDDIGRLVARQYGLPEDESIHAVKRILIDEWDHRSQRNPWA